jgi:hypothetical protein
MSVKSDKFPLILNSTRNYQAMMTKACSVVTLLVFRAAGKVSSG